MFNVAKIAHAMASKVPGGNQIMQKVHEMKTQGVPPGVVMAALETFCPAEKKHELANNQIWQAMKTKQTPEEVWNYGKSLGGTVLKDIGLDGIRKMGIPLGSDNNAT